MLLSQSTSFSRFIRPAPVGRGNRCFSIGLGTVAANLRVLGPRRGLGRRPPTRLGVRRRLRLGGGGGEGVGDGEEVGDVSTLDAADGVIVGEPVGSVHGAGLRGRGG